MLFNARREASSFDINTPDIDALMAASVLKRISWDSSMPLRPAAYMAAAFVAPVLVRRLISVVQPRHRAVRKR